MSAAGTPLVRAPSDAARQGFNRRTFDRGRRVKEVGVRGQRGAASQDSLSSLMPGGALPFQGNDIPERPCPWLRGLPQYLPLTR